MRNNKQYTILDFIPKPRHIIVSINRGVGKTLKAVYHSKQINTVYLFSKINCFHLGSHSLGVRGEPT